MVINRHNAHWRIPSWTTFEAGQQPNRLFGVAELREDPAVSVIDQQIVGH
jgi:hypothetical protein